MPSQPPAPWEYPDLDTDTYANAFGSSAAPTIPPPPWNQRSRWDPWLLAVQWIVDDRDLAGHARPPWHLRYTVLYTVMNSGLLVALVAAALVGGVYTDARVQRYAARGDTNAPAPAAVVPHLWSEPVALVGAVPPHIAGGAPPATAVPRVSTPTMVPATTTAVGIDQPIAGAPTVVPATTTAVGVDQPIAAPPTLVPRAPTVVPPAVPAAPPIRIEIPAVGIDSKIVPVGWETDPDTGAAVWTVAEYAVGHHRMSGTPGGGTNIVFAGHVGGLGQVFRPLGDLRQGAVITITTADQRQWRYAVTATTMVEERHASADQRRNNAQAIGPTSSEQVTLITCWPPTGPTRFDQRLLIKARPLRP